MKGDDQDSCNTRSTLQLVFIDKCATTKVPFKFDSLNH